MIHSLYLSAVTHAGNVAAPAALSGLMGGVGPPICSWRGHECTTNKQWVYKDACENIINTAARAMKCTTINECELCIICHA